MRVGELERKMVAVVEESGGGLSGLCMVLDGSGEMGTTVRVRLLMPDGMGGLHSLTFWSAFYSLLLYFRRYFPLLFTYHRYQKQR